MPDVALKKLDMPPTPDGYEYFNMVVFGSGGPLPPRPSPGPNPPGGGGGDGGPVDPGYGIPETGLPGWSKAAVGPPSAHQPPPADIPLAGNYTWQLVVYPDKTAAWAQVGPKIEHHR